MFKQVCVCLAMAVAFVLIRPKKKKLPVKYTTVLQGSKVSNSFISGCEPLSGAW